LKPNLYYCVFFKFCIVPFVRTVKATNLHFRLISIDLQTDFVKKKNVFAFIIIYREILLDYNRDKVI